MLPAGGTRDTRFGFDGLATEIETRGDASETTTAPDGTAVTRIEAPDPRLALAAPITRLLAIDTPGGLGFVRTQSRAITKHATTGALLTQTDTVAVNGRVSTVAYNAATAITTTTTAAGRVLFDEIDARGRLGSLSQGTGAQQRGGVLELFGHFPSERRRRGEG